jgi:serine/threonine-protein kinase
MLEHSELAPADAGPGLTLLPDRERQLGRYTLLCRLATGGMASLYLARFVGPDGFEKLVAVKRIHEHLTQNPEFVSMFIDEARLAARISHPNVAQILDLGSIEGTYFIAMEYVAGETLTSLLKLVRPDISIGARIVSDAAAGLHAAHELRGTDGDLLHLVHRDVSPSNILISYDGAVKVVDFGVARVRGKIHTTKAGVVKGKFAYMAPEQVQGREIDRRADVFSLGIMLYEVTTRRRLFRAENDAETVAKVLECEIPLPSWFLPAYPPDLEEIVLRSLQKDPADRYPTAQDLVHDLEAFIVNAGVPVLPSAVASLMRTVFAERIEQKRTMLRAAEELGEIVSFEPASSGSLRLDAPGSRMLRQLGFRRSWHAALVIALLLLAAGAAWLGGLFRPAPSGDTASRPAPVPQTQPPVPMIRVSIRALPPEARIVFGEQVVGNPCEIRQRSRSGSTPVSISAAGHATERFEVPLSEGGRWVISLRPQADARTPIPRPEHPAPPPAGAGKRRSKRPAHEPASARPATKRRVPSSEDALFPSPYEK